MRFELLAWLRGEREALDPHDDVWDPSDPTPKEEQLFRNFCQRTTALCASIDLKRQVFLLVDGKPSPVPFHQLDQCQLVPNWWNLAKAGGCELTFALVVTACNLHQAGHDVAGLVPLLDATADIHAAYIRRDSLSPKGKKVIVKKAHALEKAFHGSESLLDLVVELVNAPKDVPSIKEALEGYSVVKGDRREGGGRRLEDTHAWILAFCRGVRVSTDTTGQTFLLTTQGQVQHHIPSRPQGLPGHQVLARLQRK